MEFNNPALHYINELHTKDESYWLERGANMFWQLFEQMSVRVPAYVDVLAKYSVEAKSVVAGRQASAVPVVDKDSYLRQHDLNELSWDGRLDSQASVVAATSGSTGEPFFFPRTSEQDDAYALTAELYLLNNFEIDKRSTLYVNAFPLGIWIGGMFTYQAITSVARKADYQLSIINVGISKADVVKVVERLGGYYDQVIIGAYPPFMKDIVDDGIASGVDWSKYRMGFVFSAESFSEGFREYIYDKCGINSTSDYYRRSLNHYGTVDLGTMAHETPLAILLRKLALHNEDLSEKLFGDRQRQPTLCQYIPEQFYFEVIDQSIVCSSFSGLPLCRYDLKDSGGILGFEEIRDICRDLNIDLDAEIEAAGFETASIWQLPFVYVFERQDFSVNYYSFQLYPEAVKRGLLTEMNKGWVTGKFSMQVVHDELFNQSLEIAVELRPGIVLDDEQCQLVHQSVVRGLQEASSEFKKIRADVGKDVEPVLSFFDYESVEYFKPGGKQRWVRK